MPSATPAVPTADIFAMTIGSTSQPGKFKILNGKLIFSSGTSESSFDMLIDGINKLIQIGANNDVTLDGPNKRIKVGNTNVLIDGANKRIIISDGTNDRVLIGYAQSLF